MKDKVLDLMKANNHCVISTVNSRGQSQSAIVGFSEDEDLSVLIGTGKDSRKYKNIVSNPKVSIVVCDEDKKLEVQYEGEAKICSAGEISERMEVHFKKLPSTRRHLSDQNQTWLLIKPTWIRYVDASQPGMKYEEIKP